MNMEISFIPILVYLGNVYPNCSLYERFFRSQLVRMIEVALYLVQLCPMQPVEVEVGKLLNLSTQL